MNLTQIFKRCTSKPKMIVPGQGMRYVLHKQVTYTLFALVTLTFTQMTFTYELDLYRLKMYPLIKKSFNVTVFERCRVTDRQTDRQTPPKTLPLRCASGDVSYMYLWLSDHVNRLVLRICLYAAISSIPLTFSRLLVRRKTFITCRLGLQKERNGGAEQSTGKDPGEVHLVQTNPPQRQEML